ncbi:MAG: DUF115 domain-containing protein [Negativicutes bacterium]|nr:DUF115 domain-containing protein [Negativicutes bacterium]
MEVTVIPSLSREGVCTARIRTADGAAWYIHDRRYPLREAESWAGQVDFQPGQLVVIAGFGLGYHVKAVLDRLPEWGWLAVVDRSGPGSSMAIAGKISSRPDWLDDPRLSIVLADNERLCAGQLAELMWQKGLARLMVYCYRPVTRLLGSFFDNPDGLADSVQRLLLIKLNFPMTTAYLYAGNSWDNLPAIAGRPGNAAYRGLGRGMMAVVAAAGPSLDSNVGLLKGDKRDGLIVIAAGSAMAALHRHKVRADFVVSVDPFPAAVGDIIPYADSGAILVCGYESPKQLVDSYPGQVVFCSYDDSYFPAWMREDFPESCDLRRNVSVSTAAFSWARFLEADPIVFIGQDLAFPAGRSHADGVPSNYLHGNLPLSEVTGINGEQLLTTPMLRELRDYYEVIAGDCSGCWLINASAGGVMIRGMEHRPLAEVLDGYHGAGGLAGRDWQRRLAAARSGAGDFGCRTGREKIARHVVEFVDFAARISEKISLFRQQGTAALDGAGPDQGRQLAMLIDDLYVQLGGILSEIGSAREGDLVRDMVEIQAKLMQMSLAGSAGHHYVKGWHVSLIADNLQNIFDNLFDRALGALSALTGQAGGKAGNQ